MVSITNDIANVIIIVHCIKEHYFPENEGSKRFDDDYNEAR